ncbi:hypothetical protein [Mesorhizobium amorphae]|uniref:hypothetical protein n=1 Tax=Mesorhizobium amorphae TaxID=71433 RepID=UPI001781FCF6|nr:hypothetical protein [Mesorhizobium amorphae]
MTETYYAVRHSDILRRAFRRFVAEDNIAEAEWPKRAMEMIRSLAGHENIDPALLNWIIDRRADQSQDGVSRSA